MLDFSTRDAATGGRTGAAWAALLQDEVLRSSIITSLVLALLTTVLMLALLVPTMIWVRLRVPARRPAHRVPLPAPADHPPTGDRGGHLQRLRLGLLHLRQLGLTLTFVYVVLVLPYSYRALDSALSSINVVTLAEAARSLGAGWGTVIVRVILPNITAGVTSATFVTVALVLGEYTFTSLLNFPRRCPTSSPRSARPTRPSRSPRPWPR